MRRRLLNPKFVIVMAVWMTALSFPPSGAWAMPSGSVSALSFVQISQVRQAQIDSILAVLSRPEARAHLALMRIDEARLKDDLSKLSDQDLKAVAQKAEAVKAGGDALGLVIVLVVIALLVILIIKLAVKTVVVKDKRII